MSSSSDSVSIDLTNSPISTDVWRGLEHRISQVVRGALPEDPVIGSGSPTEDGESALLDPDTVATYVQLNQCDQYYKYRVERTDPRSTQDKADYEQNRKEAFGKILLAMEASGVQFEDAVVEFYTDNFDVLHIDEGAILDQYDIDNLTINTYLDAFFRALQWLDERPDRPPIMFDQLRLGGVIGEWPTSGRADIVFAFGTEDGVRLHIVDAKSAQDEKPHHRVQVAVYTTLLRQWLSKYAAPYDIEAQISGGIIHRQSEELRSDVISDDTDSKLTPDYIPEFDLQPAEFDVQAMLAEDGELLQAARTSQANIQYQLDQKCYQCPFNEECHAHTVENVRTALLGISGGVQHELSGQGFDTLYDLADMGERFGDALDDEYPRPRPFDYSEFELDPTSLDQVTALQDVPEMDKRLYPYVQEAQAALGDIDPQHDHAWTAKPLYWRLGSGTPSLPDDNPHEDANFDASFERGEMIRIYLNIQHDNPFDRLAMVSATVTATARDGDPIRTSALVKPFDDVEYASAYHDLLQKEQEYNDLEADLLSDFLYGSDSYSDEVGLMNAIEQVANDLGRDTYPVHFYVFSQDEKDVLLDALDRQRTRKATDSNVRQAAASLYDLFGLRSAVDTRETEQAMLSVVKPEVESHINLGLNNTGLLPMWQKLRPAFDREDDELELDDLEYTDSDGTTVDLREAFGHRLFYYSEAYTRRRNGIEFLHGDVSSEGADGYYPVRFRRGAEIPLEYIWGVLGRELPVKYDANSDDVEEPPFKETRRRSFFARDYFPGPTEAPIGPNGNVNPSDLSPDEPGRWPTEGDDKYKQHHDPDDEFEAEYTADDIDEEAVAKYDKITRKDLMELGKRLAHILADIEGALHYRDREMGEDKEPLPVNEIDSTRWIGTDEELTLAQGAAEYLHLEYNSGQQDNREHYGLRAWQRPLTGRSIIVEVTDVEALSGDPKKPPYEIECRVPYKDLGELYGDDDSEIQELLEKCRIKDATSAGSGGYTVANRLEPGTTIRAPPNDTYPDSISIDKPSHIEKGPSANVKELDLMGDEPRLRFIARNFGSYYHLDEEDPEYPFAFSKQRWCHPDDVEIKEDHDFNWGSVPVEEGDWFILDPQTSGITAMQSIGMLDPHNNATAQLLEAAERADATDPEASPQTNRFDDAGVDEFIDFIDATVGPSGLPNPQQAEFIGNTNDQVSLLQGPPGTGKTAATLAPAILARAYACGTTNDRFAAAITAPSNKAVDEVLKDLSATYTEFRDNASSIDGVDENALENTVIVRLTGDVPDSRAFEHSSAEDPPYDGIGYIDYNNPDQGRTVGEAMHDINDEHLLETVLRRIRNSEASTGAELSPPDIYGSGQTTLGGQSAPPNVVVVGTPTRLRKLMDRVVNPDVVSEVDAVELMQRGDRYFDVVAADESSMLTIPQLMIPGAFLRNDGQLMIAGDQRQMPPVNQYDWENETRPSIEAVAPHLSVLNRCRLIDADEAARMRANGEDERLGVDFDKLNFTPTADFGFTRLRVSYRCHEAVVDILGDGIYSQDGIDFRAHPDTGQRTIDNATPMSAGMQTVISPDDDPPVVLVKMDQSRGQQSNPAEAEVVQRVLEAIEGDHDSGVVTPHNAQRSIVRSRTRSSDGIDDSDVSIETVERFQGGERDVIAVSATVADPDYLSASADFALDPRRLNVAMSRMKRKLVVVASRSVFRTVPRDLDSYDRVSIWKLLHQRMSDGGSVWEGSVGELVGDADADGADIGVEVFTLSSDDVDALASD